MTKTAFIHALLNGSSLEGQKQSRGIVHIGANAGQEAKRYHDAGLNVLWIEAHPRPFSKCMEIAAPYPNQRGFCQLITDQDDVPTPFHVTSNCAESSSILELADHSIVHPEITETERLILPSLTFSTAVFRYQVNLDLYDTLLMDVQGAELQVLRGAQPVLGRFKHVITEATDFELYRGCSRIDDVEAFMVANGFVQVAKLGSGTQCGNTFVIGYAKPG